MRKKVVALLLGLFMVGLLAGTAQAGDEGVYVGLSTRPGSAIR